MIKHRQPTYKDRPPGFAGTHLANELAEDIRGLVPAIVTGEVPDEPPIGSATLPTGQYQWQHYLMVSANQAGWDDPRFSAILEDV
jgi:hypothetical protein